FPGHRSGELHGGVGARQGFAEVGVDGKVAQGVGTRRAGAKRAVHSRRSEFAGVDIVAGEGFPEGEAVDVVVVAIAKVTGAGLINVGKHHLRVGADIVDAVRTGGRVGDRIETNDREIDRIGLRRALRAVDGRADGTRAVTQAGHGTTRHLNAGGVGQHAPGFKLSVFRTNVGYARVDGKLVGNIEHVVEARRQRFRRRDAVK